MKNFHRILALLLSLLMLLSLCACGSKADDEEEDKDRDSSRRRREATTDTEKPDDRESSNPGGLLPGFGKEEASQAEPAASDADPVAELVSRYGYQWTDPNAPVLNDVGAAEISFNVYSSKNASALDYNDMKIMQDLYESTNVFVSWENVSESVYGQQKNLIFGNANERPDAIYHAGMSAGEIIKYAQRNVLLPISDYLEYMRTSPRSWKSAPTSRASSPVRTARSPTPCWTIASRKPPTSSPTGSART